MADPHRRTVRQLCYDNEYSQLLQESHVMHPRYDARTHHRWVVRRIGKRPGGGLGANEPPGRHP